MNKKNLWTGYTDKEKKEILPLEKIKLVMTRNKDDEKELYDLLGTKEYRKSLDTQFKNEKSKIFQKRLLQAFQ